MTVIIIIVITV